MGMISIAPILQLFRSYCRRMLQGALILLMGLLLVTCKAQQKSNNVQVISGKKFYIHKIEKKQSLYAISRMYAVSLDTIYKLNPVLKEGAKAGQEIRIPYELSQSAQIQQTDTNKFQWHTVSKGETIYSISRRYHLSEQQLLQYNPILKDGLKEGQRIIVGEKGRKKKDQRELAPVTLTTSPPVLPVDSTLFRPFPKPVKDQYHVSLLLPFKLEQVAGIDLQAMLRSGNEFPVVPERATDFFLGVKKAVDSLSGPGFSLTLQLYDLDDKDSLMPNQLMRDPEFLKTDLIIGPLYESSFRLLAQKTAENLHSPIISPFTQQNKILFNNIFVSKTNPSQFTLLENLADYCLDSLMLQNPNFILMTVNPKDRKESGYTEAFKAYFNNRLLSKGRTFADTIRTAKGMEGFETVFDAERPNVVVVLSTNQVSLADITTQLAIFSTGKNVVLCGWSNVTEMDNIDQEYLNQLRYTFPSQYDAGIQRIPALDAYYMQHQNTAPTEYYYIGFSVTHYYLKNLKEKGPDFIYQLDQLPAETGIMRFRFYRPDLTTGFDNRGSYIFRYNNYKLEKTGWK